LSTHIEKCLRDELENYGPVEPARSSCRDTRRGVGAGVRYNDTAAIGQALEHYRATGLIAAWRGDPAVFRWDVRLADGEEIELRSRREAWLFATALGAAARARRERS
jgi:hypothetical protein